MAGRTTFVIAHRLSTIALADEIVVLEDGRDRRARHARRAARDLARSTARSSRRACRTRSSSTASRASARWRGCERASRDRRRCAAACAGPAAAGASCAAWLELLRPYRGARRADVRRAAASRPPPRSRRRRWPSSRSTTASCRATSTALDLDRASRSSSPRSSTGARPTRRPTSSAGSASARCRTCAIQLFAHLQTLSIGFYSRRRAGVLISRMTNDVEALDQLVTDGIVTLFQSTLTLVGTAVILLVLDVAARAAHVPRVPAAAARRRSPSGSPRPTPTGARARRIACDHRLPAGDAVGDPRRALVRRRSSATWSASPSSTRTTATRT